MVLWYGGAEPEEAKDLEEPDEAEDERREGAEGGVQEDLFYIILYHII